MAPKRGKQSSSSTSVSSQQPPKKQYVVEAIVNKRILPDGQVEYLLKWQGHPDTEKSWEPEKNLNCPELIQRFNNFLKRMENAVPMSHVEEIIGAARLNNEIFYMVKYNGPGEYTEFLPSEIVKKLYPALIIEFYEMRYTEDR